MKNSANQKNQPIKMSGIKGRILQLWNSPVGMKTTHFWGPIANWGIALAVIQHILKNRELSIGIDLQKKLVV
jgi:hypothetical protein